MSLNYDPRKHGVSQGLLNTFMRCREEARNRILGLEKFRTSSALQFGSLTHRVLEIVYGKYVVKPPSQMRVLEILDHVRKEFIQEEGSRIAPEAMENLEVNCAILEAVLPEYFKYHAKEFGSSKWVELEQKFRVPSPVKDVDLVGRIDGAFNRKKEFWLFESKTKGQINEETLTDQLTFDFQTNLYQYALQSKYKRQPTGVLYNVIRRPGHRLRKDEKLDSFTARIREEVKKDPPKYFLRYEIVSPRTEMDRFKLELRGILKEFMAWFEGDVMTYRNTASCIQRYGPCAFLPLCASGDRTLYRTREHMFPELQGD